MIFCQIAWPLDDCYPLRGFLQKQFETSLESIVEAREKEINLSTTSLESTENQRGVEETFESFCTLSFYIVMSSLFLTHIMWKWINTSANQTYYYYWFSFEVKMSWWSYSYEFRKCCRNSINQYQDWMENQWVLGKNSIKPTTCSFCKTSSVF